MCSFPFRIPQPPCALLGVWIKLPFQDETALTPAPCTFDHLEIPPDRVKFHHEALPK
jgi:hypothetical protein